MFIFFRHLISSILALFIVSCLHSDQLESKYVSVHGIAKGCDLTFQNSTNPDAYLDIDSIYPGCVVWVQSYSAGKFYRDFLPYIQIPFVLVITWGDESFPTSHLEEGFDIEKFVSNENILHIFAQNCDYQGAHLDKVSPIPIGIDVHSLQKGGGAFKEPKLSITEQEAILDGVIKSLKPTTKRKKKALVDFHHADTIAYGFDNIERYLAPGETRATIAEKLSGSPVVDFLNKRLKRRKYWKKKGEYAFSISPPGNGLDCHRTWEDLLLGCIVIVHSSPMDRLYEGLPVVCIKDWSEINEANFDRWLAQFGDVSSNPDYRARLTLAHWMAKVRSYCSLVDAWK